MAMEIDSYSFGSMVVDGRTYRADLILYPDHIQERWWRAKGHYLQKSDLEGLSAAACDRLIIGTGKLGVMKVSKEAAAWFARETDSLPKRRSSS